MTLIKSLKKMKVGELKKEISNQNIKKYSKLKKNQLIDLMTSDEHKDKFVHLIKTEEELKQMKKPRSEKQKANDKKLGEMAKKKQVNKKTEQPKKETKKYAYSFDISSKEEQDDIMEIEDLIDKNKELLSKVYISRIGFKGKGRVRDINFLSYINIRLNESGLPPKEAKEISSYRLFQIKDLLKQLKNVKVGGNKDNDKEFKIGELRVLVPIKKEEPKKKEPIKDLHKMPDGSVMSGKTHTTYSKVIKKPETVKPVTVIPVEKKQELSKIEKLQKEYDNAINKRDNFTKYNNKFTRNNNSKLDFSDFERQKKILDKEQARLSEIVFKLSFQLKDEKSRNIKKPAPNKKETVVKNECPAKDNKPKYTMNYKDFLKQSRFFHPDKNPSCQEYAKKLFEVLQNHYSKIKTPELKNVAMILKNLKYNISKKGNKMYVILDKDSSKINKSLFLDISRNLKKINPNFYLFQSR
tara:strand:- start:20 stop:1420 length:1401 start_codon:yes stop_codon:yes gene_type:complete